MLRGAPVARGLDQCRNLLAGREVGRQPDVDRDPHAVTHLDVERLVTRVVGRQRKAGQEGQERDRPERLFHFVQLTGVRVNADPELKGVRAGL